MKDYNYPDLGPRERFVLDLSRLNSVLAINSSVGPVSATGMSRIIDLAAQATRIPYEFFETVLELEVSYPNRNSYSSKQPRDGDSNKRLPDPRYPHPSAWSAQPGKKYYGLANVNKNTQIYIGVTQMSFEFWDDVRKELNSKGVNRKYTPLAWWDAPLLVQIIAPLVYFSLYRRKYPSGTLVTPATVYMLHQQGPGWVQGGMKRPAGRQSLKTSTILQQARQASGYF